MCHYCVGVLGDSLLGFLLFFYLHALFDWLMGISVYLEASDRAHATPREGQLCLLCVNCERREAEMYSCVTQQQVDERGKSAF